MFKTTIPSTGEGLCQTPVDIRVKLDNEELDIFKAFRFIELVYRNIPKAKVYRLEFANERTHRWGTCFYEQKKIVLYRHCTGTFLHELAHAVRREIAGGSGHDLMFCVMLDGLINKWLEGGF
jgi:hypothetical protein